MIVLTLEALEAIIERARGRLLKEARWAESAHAALEALSQEIEVERAASIIVAEVKRDG
ncbi:MAG TPA: hypothetical protein VGJ79_00630 [Candidatus Dormibacteraeota bacterium]|jgi:phosphoribosylformimino-5-aminoimidazole carboxamide ribonucleotide (ProFAR) isomerase